MQPSPAQDPTWLDAQYNNRALVPDCGHHFARWASTSALVREQLLASGQARLDVPFGGPAPSGVAPPTLDVFTPHAGAPLGAAGEPSAGPAGGGSGRGSWGQGRGEGGLGGGGGGIGAPVLLFIHGGYWRALDKADHSFVAAPFVSQGACVVVPNYTLVGAAHPTVRVSDITAQMQQAVLWVWRHAADWGGDPARITVVGHSAGGQLVALLLATDWQALGRAQGLAVPAQALAHGVSISGLFDMEPIRRTPFLADLQLTPEEAWAQSAVHRPAPIPASLLVSPALQALNGPAALADWPRGSLAAVVGGDESSEFHRQNQRIRQAWGHQAVPLCEALSGLNHFSVLDTLAEPGSRLHGLVAGLLQKPPPPA